MDEDSLVEIFIRTNNVQVLFLSKGLYERLIPYYTIKPTYDLPIVRIFKSSNKSKICISVSNKPRPPDNHYFLTWTCYRFGGRYVAVSYDCKAKEAKKLLNLVWPESNTEYF